MRVDEKGRTIAYTISEAALNLRVTPSRPVFTGSLAQVVTHSSSITASTNANSTLNESLVSRSCSVVIAHDSLEDG